MNVLHYLSFISLGLTRSPAVVSAYLMKYGPDMSGRPLRYFEALQYVSQQRGPKVDVRLFERELLLLERHLQYIAGTLQLLSGDATPPERSPSPFDFGSPQVSSPMAVSLQLPTRLKYAVARTLHLPEARFANPFRKRTNVAKLKYFLRRMLQISASRECCRGR